MRIARLAPASTRRHIAALALAAVVALVAPTLARADWTAPFRLSPSNLPAEQGQVAITPNGDAAFTWERFNGTTVDGANFRVQARTRTAAGQLGPIMTLSDPDQDPEFPQLDVDAGGNAVVVWQRFDGANTRIEARSLSTTGVLSPVQTLSVAGQDARDPRVAVFANGNAIVTWVRFDGEDFRVQAVVRGSGGALGPVDTISAPGVGASGPQVEFDGDGNAVFVWVTNDLVRTQVVARARSAAGGYAPEQPLDDGTQDAREPRLAVMPSGKAVFVWSRSAAGIDESVRARVRSAAGVLKPVQTLSAPGERGLEPTVGVDSGGSAVFAWHHVIPGASVIEARRRTAAGTLSAIQPISAADEDAYSPRIGVTSAGDAIIVWESDSTGQPRKILERTRSSAGALGPITTLSDPTRFGQSPELAVSPLGSALVVFQRDFSATRRVVAVAGP